METPKAVPQEIVMTRLEEIIDESYSELKNELIPQLNHGEAKRLLLAVLQYPKVVADFSNDREQLVRAYSASKAITDALVAAGVEAVMDNLVKREIAAKEEAATEVKNDNT